MSSFLVLMAHQAPELLRQGVPQRDNTLSQVTLASHWPVNALMQVDQPGWHFAKFHIAFCLANHGPAPLLTFTMQTTHQNWFKLAPQYKKSQSQISSFLVLMPHQPPDLLRHGVPQRAPPWVK